MDYVFGVVDRAMPVLLAFGLVLLTWSWPAGAGAEPRASKAARTVGMFMLAIALLGQDVTISRHKHELELLRYRIELLEKDAERAAGVSPNAPR